MRTFALALLCACLWVAGCVSLRAPIHHLVGADHASAPAKPETPQQREIRLTGELAATHKEVEALRLAPLYTTLHWAEGIAALGMLAGVGLAVAARVMGLGFTAKLPLAFAAGFAAVLATALTAGWALNYVTWIVVCVLALVALGVWWLAHKHLTVTGAAKKLWNATPDDVLLPHTVEQLLDHISR